MAIQLLQETRMARGLSRRAVANALDTTEQFIYRMEKGFDNPGLQLCIKLADFYGITLDELAGRTPPTKREDTQ
jgi:DNA-binding XRE family transcriptional regulator